MSEDVFDISKLVDTFDLSITTGFKPKQDKNGDYIFSFEHQSPEIDLQISFENDSFFHMFKHTPKQMMRMKHQGRFWFDRQFEVDVIMTDLKMLKDGSISAIYDGMNIIDHTNYGRLARFLRWLLRR